MTAACCGGIHACLYLTVNVEHQKHPMHLRVLKTGAHFPKRSIRLIFSHPWHHSYLQQLFPEGTSEEQMGELLGGLPGGLMDELQVGSPEGLHCAHAADVPRAVLGCAQLCPASEQHRCCTHTTIT